MLALLSGALLILLLVTLSAQDLAQKLFVQTSYYFLFAAVLCWGGTYAYAARDLRSADLQSWLKDNWPGLVVAAGVTLVAALSVEPALRVLSDEANLLGISKNFFASKSATFTVSGKNYYGSYWDVNVAIDQRPPLFPFLVSIVHAVLGYDYKNVFTFNLLLLPAFLMVAYRLAKSAGGETLGILTALLVAAHPITLITVRSGSFDFLAALFSLLCIKSLTDFFRNPCPEHLAILWVNLCLFAEIRYESALFLPLVMGLCFVFRMVSRAALRSFAIIYALTPVFLLPRIWLSMLRGNVPKQEPGTVTFGAENFVENFSAYFAPLLDPGGSYPAHSALLILLGLGGCALWLGWLAKQIRRADLSSWRVRLGLSVLLWMLAQMVIVFSYTWGRPQYPSAARLLIPIDTFLSFAAAWALAWALRRVRAFVPVSIAVAVLLTQLPIASRHRMMNQLTQTRENAATWNFFEKLGTKRILIVTDRPNHFTIMNYGAMSFESARTDPYLLIALERRLFHDVYVIQQVQLSTGAPAPGYEVWPDRRLEPVFEFQNDADVLVRISRVPR